MPDQARATPSNPRPGLETPSFRVSADLTARPTSVRALGRCEGWGGPGLIWSGGVAEAELRDMYARDQTKGRRPGALAEAACSCGGAQARSLYIHIHYALYIFIYIYIYMTVDLTAV
jgi:hypothetical protein